MIKSSGFENFIRKVDDFPDPGIRFYDISPLIGNGALFGSLIKEMAEPLRGRISKVVAFDARGFIFGAALARELTAGCVMLRKTGKLPGDTHSVTYDLEYGSNALEIQTDVIDDGEKVVLVDDVIATGGTALAGIELAEKCGAEIVEFCAVIDLPRLGGSTKLREQGVHVRPIMELGN